jgi:hypothetical protein
VACEEPPSQRADRAFCVRHSLTYHNFRNSEMAKAGPRLQKRFPLVANWVANSLPTSRQKPGVWKAFVKWSQLPEQVASALVASKQFPIIGVTEDNKINGKFSSKTPNVIYLSSKLCRGSIRGLNPSFSSQLSNASDNSMTSSQCRNNQESSSIHHVVCGSMTTPPMQG